MLFRNHAEHSWRRLPIASTHDHRHGRVFLPQPGDDVERDVVLPHDDEIALRQRT